jgi:HTH-type transcriptional regulator / antitoxin HigA
MPDSYGFAPRWASPPGETIIDVLNDRHIDLDQFARMVDLSHDRLQQLLAGEFPISISLARRLSRAIGGTIEFWITRDGQYRDDLARVEADRWAQTLPLREMAALGWIERPVDWHDRLAQCLAFFGVPDVRGWASRYGDLVENSYFRASTAFPMDAGAVAAWLRRGEIEAESLETAAWQPAAFRQVLESTRPLTREPDPAVFVPALTRACARAGVALAVIRAPKGCPVSGVARFLEDGQPLIMLSGRYLVDDHFWFTFYHEAAHLLLHDSQAVFLDELTVGESNNAPAVEREANDFAAERLLPRSLVDSARDSRLTARDIVRIARKAGVAPGVVVGQLQYAGILGFNRQNALKRRYRWLGATLGRA